jgi:hypothetical protein
MPPTLALAVFGAVWTKESTAPSAISNVVELLPKEKPLLVEFVIVVLTSITVVSALRQGARSATAMVTARTAARTGLRDAADAARTKARAGIRDAWDADAGFMVGMDKMDGVDGDGLDSNKQDSSLFSMTQPPQSGGGLA